MTNENFINLEGEKIPIANQRVDIFKLNFFPENPRILSLILEDPKLKHDNNLIEKALWNKNEPRKLYKSIEKHGGLITPIIVHKNFVLEGNTRLCCYRRLFNTTHDKKWQFIECQVLLTDNLPKDKIEILLGNEHIIGKQEWDTFEKGCWMNKLLKEDKYTTEKIAEIVGHSKQWVNVHIQAYETMIKEKILDSNKFSHFVQIYSNGDINKIKNNQDNNVVKEIIRMVKNDQIPTAQDIRKIPKLWKDKKSKVRLLSGEDINEVFTLQKMRDITLNNSFLNNAEDLTTKMKRLTLKQREEIRKDNKGKFIIKKLANESNALLREIDG